MELTPFAQSVMTMGQQRGYSPTAIAAILGNGQQESGNDPETDPGDNGTAFGAMQWRGPRYAALQGLAKAQGKDVSDPDIQATHLFNELDGPESKAGAALKSATDLNSANDAMKSYLRYGDDSYNTRLQNATEWSKNLGGAGASKGALSSALPLDPKTPSAVGGLYDALTGGPGALSAVGPDGLNASGRFGDGLTGLGAALMARDNPAGAAVLNSSLNSDANRRVQLAQLAMQKQKLAQQQNAGTLLAKGDKNLLMQRPDGSTYTIPATTINEPDDGKDKLTAPISKQALSYQKDLGATSNLVDDMNTMRKFIADNDLKMNILQNGVAQFANASGNANANSAAIKEAERLMKRMQYNIVTSEAGPTTKQKLQAALETNFPVGAQYDPVTYSDAVTTAQKQLKDNFGATSGAYKALSDTTKGLNSEIRDTTGKSSELEDFTNGAFDRWNKFEQDFAPQYETYKKNHLAGTPGKPSFKTFFQSQ